MKKTIILIFCIAITILSFSQNEKKFNPEKIKSQKIAFITEKLNLTIIEAQNFWPVYNEKENKIGEIFKNEFEIYKYIDGIDLSENKTEYSNEKVLNKINRLAELNFEKATIEKEYYEKFKNILSPQKLALLYKTEKDFRKYILKNEKGK